MIDTRFAVPVNPAPTTMTVSDRCDQCGAQALVLVGLASGHLLFCGHHFIEHAPILAGTFGAAVLIDHRPINMLAISGR